MQRTLLLLALGTLMSGCGSDAVDEAREASSAPYDGPTHVELDHSDKATPDERGGAAALALECTGETFYAGGGDYANGGLESVRQTPSAALVDVADPTKMQRLPSDGGTGCK